MIIKEITIQNFRSYYGKVRFELSEGFNLIIGSNGDGKTTFFDALHWLFRTDGTQQADKALISKKREKELNNGDYDSVQVSLTYDNDDDERTLVKSFVFRKDANGVIHAESPSFELYKRIGTEKTIVRGDLYERDFPKEIRQYSMFKGETELNIFKSPDALRMLVNLFSDVKDFEPYIGFMKYAAGCAATAAENARKTDRKNLKRITDLENDRKKLMSDLEDVERDLRKKENESANFERMLNDIENCKEASELLEATNRRISSLESKKATLESKLYGRENYNARLLDDMWILQGMDAIANEYMAKVAQFSKAKRKATKDYHEQKGAKKLVNKIDLGFIPLAANVPDRSTLEELLHDEVCKVCGRPAPKGSDPWLFMKHKLEDFLASMQKDAAEEDDEDDLFVRHYTEELTSKATTLNDNMGFDLVQLKQRISTEIDNIDSLHNQINAVRVSLEKAEDDKNRILADNEGYTEDQLKNAYEEIINMGKGKRDADLKIQSLKMQQESLNNKLEEVEKELMSISKDSAAGQYAISADVMERLQKAFKEAKKQNKKDLLTKIEERANEFLDKLNINDFKGRIILYRMSEDVVMPQLVNVDKMEMTNTNTALRTTMNMAILFSISSLSHDKNETEYPLIFDAPTSSFADAKETQFFNILGTLEKQIIVVTKSFLKDVGDGHSELDNERVGKINGCIMRIAKKTPFDDRDLATIQTVLIPIK